MTQEVFFLIATVLLGLLLFSLWAVLYQLVKQQGRMLLRLDDVESRLEQAGAGVPAAPPGLPVGTPVNPFRLPDLEGRTVSLGDFAGKRVLWINWDPGCGFCDLVAPDLARMQAGLRRHNVQLLLLSDGAVGPNRKMAMEHRLDCPILLLPQGGQTPEAFDRQGTPVAYLLDEHGRVARPVAVGAEDVLALAREAAGERHRRRLRGERPLSESRIERNGLKAGTPAPAFRLPDLDGRPVALEDFRGRRVLLVFTDPHCGPCDELAPQLARMHRPDPDDGLAVVVVGRGEPGENRRKAEEFGFEFPVVLQDRWKLSMEYGIFAAPVAFLIDKEGVIARDVARGVDEILALAADGLLAGAAGRETTI